MSVLIRVVSVSGTVLVFVRVQVAIVVLTVVAGVLCLVLVSIVGCFGGVHNQVNALFGIDFVATWRSSLLWYFIGVFEAYFIANVVLLTHTNEHSVDSL